MKPEREILHEILLALGARPDLIIWRQNTMQARAASGRMVRSCPDGVADILGCLQGGRFLAIEVKSETGALRPAQRAWLARMQQLGALVVVARSAQEAVAAVGGRHSDGVGGSERARDGQ